MCLYLIETFAISDIIFEYESQNRSRHMTSSGVKLISKMRLVNSSFSSQEALNKHGDADNWSWKQHLLYPKFQSKNGISLVLKQYMKLQTN